VDQADEPEPQPSADLTPPQPAPTQLSLLEPARVLPARSWRPWIWLPLGASPFVLAPATFLEWERDDPAHLALAAAIPVTALVVGLLGTLRIRRRDRPISAGAAALNGAALTAACHLLFWPVVSVIALVTGQWGTDDFRETGASWWGMLLFIPYISLIIFGWISVPVGALTSTVGWWLTWWFRSWSSGNRST
jgi:hypothetical protein